MSATTTNKENLVSFAFAYFMKTSPEKEGDQTHFDDWNEIFENFKITEIKLTYKSFLESNFNYSGLKDGYAYNKSKGEKPTLLEQLEETAKKDSGSSDPVYFEPLGSASRQRLIEKMDRIYFMKDFGASSTKLRDIFYKYF
ncbi:hypothetical protein EBZ38_16995, partial [bacterium]|nr:hypothetical protein [bacterium]